MHPQITVHVLHRDAVTAALPFAQPVIRIGRLRESRDGPNDIVLNAPRVSAAHAHILVDASGLTVVDHSVNGTFVNGEPIKAPRQLVPGDRIEIDAYTLRCEQAAALAASPPTRPPSPDPLPLVPLDDLPNLDLPLAPPPPSSLVPAAPDLESSPPSLPEVPPLTRVPTLVTTADDPAPPVSPGDALARLYRRLAAQFGAPAWGRPPPLDRDALARVTAAARQAAQGLAFPPGPWLERIAGELCGLGPLAALLDDPAVTHVVVRGHEAIDVSRGTERELAAGNFSCAEAIHAVVERWTGARLEDGLERAVSGDLVVHAWTSALALGGPLLAISRARTSAVRTLEDLVVEHALPRAGAELLQLAVRRELNVLVHGGPGADLSTVLIALAGELPPARGLAVVRRGSTWPKSHALLLDGHGPATWPCVRRLAAEWLAVEELALADLPELVALARHRGGGTLATVRAGSPEAALQRLATMLATVQGDLPACRQFVAGCFDALVGVHLAPGGRLRVDSIAEVRPRGELAELFAWKPDASTVEPTALTPQVLR